MFVLPFIDTWVQYLIDFVFHPCLFLPLFIISLVVSMFFFCFYCSLKFQVTLHIFSKMSIFVLKFSPCCLDFFFITIANFCIHFVGSFKLWLLTFLSSAIELICFFCFLFETTDDCYYFTNFIFCLEISHHIPPISLISQSSHACCPLPLWFLYSVTLSSHKTQQIHFIWCMLTGAWSNF